MGLFKSKVERKMERDMKIRSGLSKIKRQIKTLEKNEGGYLVKARRARELGDTGNQRFVVNALKKTIAQRRMLERQLLTLETAIQIKDQAESHAQFAGSMAAISKSIAEAFESTDLTASIRDFEKAVSQAESLEQRMDLLLDLSEEQMEASAEAVDTGVSDAEINALIGGSPAKEGPAAQLEGEISEELRQIEKELGGA